MDHSWVAKQVSDEATKQPPGPSANDGFEIPTRLQELLDSIVGLGQRYGDVVRCPTSYGFSYFVNSPSCARKFLTEKRYERTQLLSMAMGQSSLSIDGEPWKRRRKLVQPAFRPERLRGFAELMIRETEDTLDRWTQAASRRETIDVEREMMRLTLLIVVKALLSTDVEEHVDQIGEALTVVIEDIAALSGTTWGMPVAFSPKRNKRVKAALGSIDAIVFRIIEERHRMADPGDDLLGMLLRARDDETGARLDDNQLRDEVITMMVAGHETTATMLTWCWYLLGRHPQVEARWHDEVDKVLGGRRIEHADIENMPYTRWVINETLRLYPPVWNIARKTAVTHEVNGYELETGHAAFISPYTLHRHSEAWPDNPEAFEPARWDKEPPSGTLGYRYVPFGGGPHLCVGQHFALLEGHLILPTIGQRFRLSPVSDAQAIPEPLVTMRVRNGLQMKLQPREIKK